MARRIDEGDRAAVARDGISTDVLRDAAGLAFRNAAVADRIEQGGLAVVNVAHNGHNRRALHELAGFIHFVAALLKNFFEGLGDIVFKLDAVIGRDQRAGVEIDLLVDRGHNAEDEELLDDLRRRLADLFGEFLHCNGFRGNHRFLDLYRFRLMHGRLLLFLFPGAVCAVIIPTAGRGRSLLHDRLLVLRLVTFVIPRTGMRILSGVVGTLFLARSRQRNRFCARLACRALLTRRALLIAALACRTLLTRRALLIIALPCRALLIATLVLLALLAAALLISGLRLRLCLIAALLCTRPLFLPARFCGRLLPLRRFRGLSRLLLLRTHRLLCRLLRFFFRFPALLRFHLRRFGPLRCSFGFLLRRFLLLRLFFMRRFRRFLRLLHRQLFIRLAHVERKALIGSEQLAQALRTLVLDALLFGRLFFFYQLTLGAAHFLQRCAHIGMRFPDPLKKLLRLLLQLLCRIDKLCFRHYATPVLICVLFRCGCIEYHLYEPCVCNHRDHAPILADRPPHIRDGNAGDSGALAQARIPFLRRSGSCRVKQHQPRVSALHRTFAGKIARDSFPGAHGKSHRTAQLCFIHPQ